MTLCVKKGRGMETGLRSRERKVDYEEVDISVLFKTAVPDPFKIAGIFSLQYWRQIWQYTVLSNAKIFVR